MERERDSGPRGLVDKLVGCCTPVASIHESCPSPGKDVDASPNRTGVSQLRVASFPVVLRKRDRERERERERAQASDNQRRADCLRVGDISCVTGMV